MRISCASFVRIQTYDGRLALLVNKNQLKQGRTVLTPIGGALEVTRAQGQEIMTMLQLNEADFDKLPTTEVELRFTIDDTKIELIRRSFLTWDSGPSRELREELIDETGILTEDDFHEDSFALVFVGMGEETAVSDRSGKASGQTTLRLASVYELVYGHRIAEKLDDAANLDRPMLYFVTPAEIEANKTVSGIKIASIAKLLLDPKV